MDFLSYFNVDQQPVLAEDEVLIVPSDRMIRHMLNTVLRNNTEHQIKQLFAEFDVLVNHIFIIHDGQLYSRGEVKGSWIDKWFRKASLRITQDQGLWVMDWFYLPSDVIRQQFSARAEALAEGANDGGPIHLVIGAGQAADDYETGNKFPIAEAFNIHFAGERWVALDKECDLGFEPDQCFIGNMNEPETWYMLVETYGRFDTIRFDISTCKFWKGDYKLDNVMSALKPGGIFYLPESCSSVCIPLEKSKEKPDLDVNLSANYLISKFWHRTSARPLWQHSAVFGRHRPHEKVALFKEIGYSDEEIQAKLMEPETQETRQLFDRDTVVQANIDAIEDLTAYTASFVRDGPVITPERPYSLGMTNYYEIRHK